jgi:hypothetical protein
MKKAVVKTPRVVSPRVPVTETNLKKAALRLLNQRLVSTEMQYVRHVLGTSATQVEMDETVLAVRKMPWSSIVVPE